MFCKFFEIVEENFDPNQSSLTLCDEHYYKYYHHINSCKICSARLQQGTKHKIPPENLSLVLSYYESLDPDKKLVLTADDNVCSSCYFLSRALITSNKSVSSSGDLKSITEGLTEPSCVNKQETSTKKCIIFVAEKFLNNEAVLFPEVHELYLSGLDESDSNDEATSSKCSRWVLVSSLSSALSDHITFHKLPSHKLVIMLYRKGSDILTSLHYLLYQVRLKKKNSNESEGLLKLGLSLSEEALLFRAARTLDNILISKADASKKAFIDDDVDISKISLANLISDTDSKLWNFIYLLTMNKTLRQDTEKECGVDWSSHICHSSESNREIMVVLLLIQYCLN